MHNLHATSRHHFDIAQVKLTSRDTNPDFHLTDVYGEGVNRILA